ncbi:MAG: YafY family protein [Pseudomonadota bacterium]
MRRADRLLRIIDILRSGRLITAAQMAETLEVSPRTVYRDIADLMANRVPIEGEAGLGYVMRNGYDLPPLMFSSDEVVALVGGARLIRAWGGVSMAKAADAALDKIAAVLPDSEAARAGSVHIHAFRPDTLDRSVAERIDQIEAATEAACFLTFQYSDSAGAMTERTVRALGLWFWGKVWTMIAWCELRQDFRMFRVDRMSDLTEGAAFDLDPEKTLTAFRKTQPCMPPD